MEYIGSISFDDKLYQSEQIIICGAGQKLPVLLNRLKMMRLLDRVTAICDGNTELWGKEINEIPVYSYEKAIQNYPNADFIAYNRFAVEIIYEIGLRVAKIHLVRLENY